MLKFKLSFVVLFISLVCCKSNSPSNSSVLKCFSNFGQNIEWSTATEVIINGYSQNAMEPKISLDQVVLFWNDKPSSDDQMNLHYAIRNGSGEYDYIGVLSGTVDSNFLDGVPSVDQNGKFYFVSLRNYESNFRTLFSGDINVLGPSSLEVNNIISADTTSSASTNGILDMDLDVTWDGTQAVVSRALFSGNPYPESSQLKYYNVTSGVLSLRSDTDTVFENLNFEECRVYAGSLSRDKLEVFFTVLPKNTTDPNNFRIAVAKRSQLTDVFSNPEFIQGISGEAIEGPSPTFDDNSKTLFYHRFDTASGRFKIYKVSRP